MVKSAVSKRTERKVRAPVQANPIMEDAPSAKEGDPSSHIAVKPVVNAINILRYLGKRSDPVRSVQIARDLRINNSTCFNILRTLVAEDMLAFDDASKTYRVGLGLSKLVENAVTESQRLASVTPLLQDLAEQYKVTATLWRRTSVDRNTLIMTCDHSSLMRIHMSIGHRIPVLIGGTGRLFAKRLGLTKTELRAAFKRLHLNRPLSFEDFWKEVEISEKRGWAIDEGYFAKGVTTVSAAIFDPNGDPAFSISAAMFFNQHTSETIEEMAKDIKQLAAQVAYRLF